MKTNDELPGCGGCFLVAAIVTVFLLLMFASCAPKFYNYGSSSYGGQIKRIDHMTIDGCESMLLHTGKLIVRIEYDNRVELDDSIFFYETAPTSFYEPFQWVVIDGRKYSIK